jgi:hypothetical protein
MTTNTIIKPSLLSVVALLDDRPADKLARGQVGTVVELLADDRVLVEFSDDTGRPYAVIPCTPSDLLVLHHEPQAA